MLCRLVYRGFGLMREDVEQENPNTEDHQDPTEEPREDGVGKVRGFGRGVGSVPPQEDEKRWWPSCFHARWTKIDRTKFKDRIVLLKECRKCGKKKSEVVYRDLNSRNVYTATDVFAIPKVVQDPKEPA